MDKMFNFTLESALISLTNTEDVRSLLNASLPYLERHRTTLTDCLEEDNCVGVEDLIGNIGDTFVDSIHPPHILNDQSQESPSAFIPFCAFKSVLGIGKTKVKVPGISFPICDQFRPVTLNGQLCYHLGLNK